MNGYKRWYAIGLLVGVLVLPAVVAVRSQSNNGPQYDDVPAAASKEWPVVGGDRNDTHYSTLSQINKENVKSLGGAWMSKEFDDGASARSTPVVKGGLMFLTAGTRIYALDAKTGETRWKYRSDSHPLPGNGNIISVQTSGFSVPDSEGLTTGGGSVFVGLMDGHMIAVDQETGNVEWSEQIGGPPPKKEGTQVSDPPVYWRGVLYFGMSADYGLRGRVFAIDAKTGKELWHWFDIPGPGEVGHDTWPQNTDAWTRGGGGIWLPGTIDPDLGLVYFGTGNGVPQFGGEARPGNNLFVSSVVALDMKTGKLRWYFQVIHHEIWEADIATPVVLYDAQVAGQPRKAIAAMRADGYLFLLDRETGKPIIPVEERPVPQDAIQKTSPTQPYPIGGEGILPDCSTYKGNIPDGFVLGCTYSPGSVAVPNLLATGFSVRVTPMSYSPQTGYFYAQGTGGLSWRRKADDPYYFGPNGKVPGLKSIGVLAAIDSRTDKIAWKKEMPPALLGRGGSLTTAGGLMFHLGGDGNFTAYDAKTGDVLWQFQTGFPGGGGPPSTFEIGGEQYIAVSAGPVVWAFKLGGTLQPLPAPALPRESQDAFTGPIEDTKQIETTSLQRDIDTTGQRYFIDEYSFNPYRARIEAGTRVTWINNGRLVHTITAKDGSWTTGPISAGAFGFATFDKPGTYTYISKEYPWSYGEIIVTPATNDSAKSAAIGTPAKNSSSSGGGFAGQAQRGKDEYNQSCGSCHGQDLSGRDPAPALVGDTFEVQWLGRSVDDLFARVHTTMPQTSPGSLPPQTYLDIVAFLLQANNISVGSNELTDNAESLKKIKISSK